MSVAIKCQTLLCHERTTVLKAKFDVTTVLIVYVGYPPRLTQLPNSSEHSPEEGMEHRKLMLRNMKRKTAEEENFLCVFYVYPHYI